MEKALYSMGESTLVLANGRGTLVEEHNSLLCHKQLRFSVATSLHFQSF